MAEIRRDAVGTGDHAQGRSSRELGLNQSSDTGMLVIHHDLVSYRMVPECGLNNAL